MTRFKSESNLSSHVWTRNIILNLFKTQTPKYYHVCIRNLSFRNCTTYFGMCRLPFGMMHANATRAIRRWKMHETHKIKCESPHIFASNSCKARKEEEEQWLGRCRRNNKNNHPKPRTIYDSSWIRISQLDAEFRLNVCVERSFSFIIVGLADTTTATTTMTSARGQLPFYLEPNARASNVRACVCVSRILREKNSSDSWNERRYNISSRIWRECARKIRFPNFAMSTHVARVGDSIHF